MQFKHFIITRFNVSINAQEFSLRLSESWLYERFEMFNQFCFPSIVAQTNQDFTWIILFDEQTPAPFKAMIRAFCKYKNLVPLFCRDFTSVMPTVRQYISENREGCDYTLTTRLDNDDGLSNSFVGTLHKIVSQILGDTSSETKELYINFPNGFQYNKGDVYSFRDVTNAFVSLLETSSTVHTVYWVDHPNIYNKAPVAQVETSPIYLQNVHDHNVYNYIRGEKIGGVELLTNFTLQL